MVGAKISAVVNVMLDAVFTLSEKSSIVAPIAA